MLGDIVSSSTNGACYTQSSRDNVLSSPGGSDIQCSHLIYSNTCVKRVSQKDRKIGYKNNNRLVHVKSIAECSKGGGGHSAIRSTFIKLPFVTKLFILPRFEWPFYTGFTIQTYLGSKVN